PLGPRRLLDRRDAARDREQPDRFHDRSERGPIDALFERPPQGLPHPDHPLIHVNADDPEAAISAVRLALAFRRRFESDVVLDLVGYRRHGHNEQDEAAYTQPRMVAEVGGHPTVRALFAQRLIEEGIVTEPEAEQFVADVTA